MKNYITSLYKLRDQNLLSHIVQTKVSSAGKIEGRKITFNLVSEQGKSSIDLYQMQFVYLLDNVLYTITATTSVPAWDAVKESLRDIVSKLMINGVHIAIDI